MDRVLTDDVWSQIAKEFRGAERRMVAVAYVTSARNLKLAPNDILVCNASDSAIGSRQTSAKLLQSKLRREVEIWSRSDLHSKAAVFGKYALIGSSNLSESSEKGLTELALFTDRGQVVSQVTAFVLGLRESSVRVDREFIQRILKIPLSAAPRRAPRRRSATRLGNKTWLISVRELRGDRYPKERHLVDQGEAKAHSLVADKDSTISNIRWIGKSAFRTDARPGDRIIQISTSITGKRKTVIGPCTIVWRQDDDKWTRFYYLQPENCKTVTWTGFKKSAKEHGLSPNRKGRELNPQEILEFDLILM